MQALLSFTLLWGCCIQAGAGAGAGAGAWRWLLLQLAVARQSILFLFIGKACKVCSQRLLSCLALQLPDLPRCCYHHGCQVLKEA
jgi:hypothetical protein